jgi:diaminohydroxyphosphoribosylaminopyrimidine deaminase/5-amino-6-(5-phosphoribosylamino)uracil reductase
MALRRDHDERGHMLRALRLAERGRGATRPNPVVGAVLVRGGRVVGEGWHSAAGTDHAEIVALKRAGARARGATLFVTLEPCAHVGRTPPCVDALIAAGIKRCVVAMRDPHRIVNGRGIARLRRAGIAVEVGLCGAEARRTLEGYVSVHLERRPRVTWKLGMSLDGRIADSRGHSRWITGGMARARGHRLRAHSDAVVIGARTARADDPRLTARVPGARLQPLRVVCDTHLRLPLTLRLFRPPLARGTVVACGRGAGARRRRALEARGVTVWPLPLRDGRVSAGALARRLVAAGCHDVLLEGGAALGSDWLRRRLVDRLALFVAPLAIGERGLAWCGRLGRDRLEDALRGRLIEQRRVGEDAFLMIEMRR